MKRIFPENFWGWYREDLEKFLAKPRSVLMGFLVTIVIATAYIITPYSFAFLIFPFLYSLYPAHIMSKPDDDPPIRAF